MKMKQKTPQEKTNKSDTPSYIETIALTQKQMKEKYTISDIVKGEHIIQRENIYKMGEVKCTEIIKKNIKNYKKDIKKEIIKTGKVIKKIYYISILSRLKDLNNKKETQEKRILKIIQPGDLIFMIGGGRRGRNGEKQNTSLVSKLLEGFGGQGNHIAIITENQTIIQSTLKKYNKKRNGVDELPLIQELNTRPGTRIVIGRPKRGVKNALKIAREALKNEIQFRRMDAIKSILFNREIETKTTQKGEKMNCASLISTCYPDFPQTGLPSKILNSDKIELIYSIQWK